MSKFAQYQQPMPPGYSNPQYASPHQPYTPEPSPPVQQGNHEAFLSEAFPGIDRSTVAAILTSTRGNVDSAYNALLAISGQPQPDNHNAPALPPRPAYSPIQQQHSSENLHPPNYTNQYSNNITPVQSAQSSYLAPTSFAPTYPSPANSPHLRPHSGSITPLYPPASPNLSAHGSPSQYQDGLPPSYMPDMSRLNLDEPKSRTIQQHWASCDGCGADPITTTRWRCLKCANYDLCDQCKEEGVHNQHRLEKTREVLEVHTSAYCDGCGNVGGTSQFLQGVRYVCKNHDNEDWCEKCIKSGKACGGPYEEIKQTELGRCIELNSCLPVPREWEPYLRPAVATYNVCCGEGATSWIDDSAGYTWHTTTSQNKGPELVFKVETKNSKGHFVSDHKRSWVFCKADGTKLFSYMMENDRKTNVVKTEEFSEYKGKSTRPVFKHGSNSDSLSFEDPRTGVQYRWLSNRPISNLNDERWDFQRYALFQRQRHGLGHREVIVADHTWWNGDAKKPSDSLSIRDGRIDHAMVIASFEVMITYQWQLMREEKDRDPENFWQTEEKARLTRRGNHIHWHHFESSQVQKDVNKSTTAQKLQTANKVFKVASAGMDVFNAASGYVDASGGAAAAVACGGGGGGGGGGCGGGGGGC